MNEYQLYNVDDCDTFADFLSSIHSRFNSKIAFSSRYRNWTYNEVYEYISKGVCFFAQNNAAIYWINISTPIYFFIAYFSIVIAGKCAYLSDQLSDELKGTNLFVVSEKDILTIISNGEHKHINLKSFPSNPYSMFTLVKSSGTTSVSKLVMISQNNLLSDTIAGMRLYEYREESVYLNILPYTHLFGIVADLLGPLYSGGRICCTENKLDFFNDLRFFKPTNLNLPPVLVESIYNVLIQTKSFETATGGRLKKIMCAGAKMNDDVNLAFESYGCRAYTAYGLTECSPCVSLSRDEQFKEGSAGKVLPCCKVKIDNGEIAVFGSNVMIGYYNDPESTSRVIQNGWLYTGDLGYIDEDGFLFIVGRKNNLIVLENGEKLSPEKIENEIIKVELVEECLVEEEIKYGRHMIKITAVCDNIDNEVKTKIMSICIDIGIWQYVSNVVITQQSLKKNALGKIVRTNINK